VVIGDIKVKTILSRCTDLHAP